MIRNTLEAGDREGGDAVLGEGALDAPLPTYDVVLVHQQGSRALTEALIRQAATKIGGEGTLVLTGGTQEGINVAAHVLDDVCADVREEPGARGARVLCGRRPRPDRTLIGAIPATEHRADLDGVDVRWLTKPGVFSADGPDPASQLLIENVRLPHKGRILDLGCGAGMVGLWAALRMPGTEVTMVDSDCSSVACAHAGIEANGLTNAVALLSDGVDAVRVR